MTGPAVVSNARRRLPSLAVYGLGLYVLAVLIFILLPIVIVVWASFSSASFIGFPIPGYSLRWYERLQAYEPFVNSLVLSIELALASTALGAGLGVPAAIWIARSRGLLPEMAATFLLAPISTPLIVLGFSLLYFLAAIGLGVSFVSLLIAHTVVAIPYVTRTTLAVTRSIPSELEEAAAILGASRLQTLFYVTLPLIRSGIFAGALFAILISLDNLPLSYFLSSANTNTLPVMMLSYLQWQFDPSIAAMAAIQMLIALIALFVVHIFFGIDKFTAA